MNTRELYQTFYRRFRADWNADCAASEDGICEAIEHLMETLNYWQNRYEDERALPAWTLKLNQLHDTRIVLLAAESLFNREYPSD